MDRITDVLGRVIADAGIEAGWHLLLEFFQLDTHTTDDVDDVGVGLGKYPREYRGLAGIAYQRVIVLGAQLDVSDILQPHDGVIPLVNHQAPEVLGAVHIGVGSEIGLHQRTLGTADGGQVVVGRQCRPDLRGTDVQRRHVVRLEPDPHRKGARAEDFDPLYPRDRSQAWLNHASKVVGDLFWRQDPRPEAEIGRGEFRVGGLHTDRRHLGLGRQVVAHLIDLGGDVGERLGGVIVELEPRSDDRDALQTLRLDIVNAFSCGYCSLERRRDEAAHQFGAGADIHGGDLHRGVFAERILAHAQRMPGAQPGDDDQQIDHCRQHRATDKQIGEAVHIREFMSRLGVDRAWAPAPEYCR